MCWFRQSCPSTSTAAHSHTGLFVDRSHTSSSLGFIKAVKAAGCHKKKAGLRIASAPCCMLPLCARFCARGNRHRLPKQAAHAHAHHHSVAAAHRRVPLSSRFRSAPGWLRCLQYTPLLRECQHFPCTFMQERCNFDKLHKPTGLAGYGLAKFLQTCYTICYSHTT